MVRGLDIRTNSTDSVYALDKNKVLDVDVHQTSRVLLNDRLKATIDAYEVYRDEVIACNRYRIISTLVPYCTNVLFNPCTEIDVNEGSFSQGVSDIAVSVLDDGIHTYNDNDTSLPDREIFGENTNLSRFDMVRNTEHSKRQEITYHAGLDIFGNHLFRNTTFRKINKYRDASARQEFNTEQDMLRNYNFDSVDYFPRLSKVPSNARPIPMPMYDITSLLSTEESIEQNLSTENGWYGFYNGSTPKEAKERRTYAEYVINSANGCDFIDMYPDRSLYSFNPKYNAYRKRLEDNWGIFLTYPYRNFTAHPLISNVGWYGAEGGFTTDGYDGATHGLLVFTTEQVQSIDGGKGILMRTLSRHGMDRNANVYFYFSHDRGQSYERTTKPFRVANTGDMAHQYKENYLYFNDISLLGELFRGHILEYFYRQISTVPYRYKESAAEDGRTYTDVPTVPATVDALSPEYIRVDSGATETYCLYDYYERKYTYNEYMATGIYSYVPIREEDITAVVNWTVLNSFPLGQVPRNPNAGSPRYVRVFTGQQTRPAYKYYKKILDCVAYDGEPDTLPETNGENISVCVYDEIAVSPVLTWSESNTFNQVPERPMAYPEYIRVRQAEYNYFVYNYNTGTYSAESEIDVPRTWVWSDENTFDDIPSNTRIQHIRVPKYKFYVKSTKYYSVINTYTGSTTIDPSADVVGLEVAYRLANTMSIRLRRYHNGYESDYYIRKFKKIPNWKYSRDTLTEDIAADKVAFDDFVVQNATGVDGRMYDFDREVSPLAFAKTLYSDAVAQAVFTDTVDIEYLVDNLGRPLTDIYTTVVKNNTGYKDWYLKHKFADYEEDGIDHKIEYSHCFGRLSHGFDFMIREEDKGKMDKRGWFSDVSRLTYPIESGGDGEDCMSLEQWEYGLSAEASVYDDEFYGDLVEFIPAECRELVLQNAQIRFNTAQREIGLTQDYTFQYYNIVSEEYDSSTKEYHTEFELTKLPDNKFRRKEGYFYNPHFPMKAREFGPVVRQESHKTVNVVAAAPIQMDGMFIKIKSAIPYTVRLGQKVFICDDANGLWYETYVAHIIDNYTFAVTIIPRDVEVTTGLPYVNWITTCERINDGVYKVRASNINIPSYAIRIDMNTFLWREIIRSGSVNAVNIPEYPFYNGCLYINQDIRLYLRRQDPFGWSGLYTGKMNDVFADKMGTPMEESPIGYIEEKEAEC